MLGSPWASSTRPHPTTSGVAVVLASTLVGLTMCQAPGPRQSSAGRVDARTTTRADVVGSTLLPCVQ